MGKPKEVVQICLAELQVAGKYHSCVPNLRLFGRRANLNPKPYTLNPKGLRVNLKLFGGILWSLKSIKHKALCQNWSPGWGLLYAATLEIQCTPNGS